MTLPHSRIKTSALDAAFSEAAATARTLSTPYEAIDPAPLMDAVAMTVFGLEADALPPVARTHLEQTVAAHASSRGWTTHQHLEDPRRDRLRPAFTRPLTPDLDAFRSWLWHVFDGNPRVPYGWELLRPGLAAAFSPQVYEDPGFVLTLADWNAGLAELGFAWDGDPDARLTPLLPEIPPEAVEEVRAMLASLPRYHVSAGAGSDGGERPAILSLRDLSAALAARFGWSAATRRLPPSLLLELPILRRVLVVLGWNLVPHVVAASQLDPVPPDGKTTCVLERALHYPVDARPTEIAAGFFPYVTRWVAHQESLVYLEMVGPRTVLKASWAHLMANRRHRLFGRELLIRKEDGMDTVKAPLPCGWEQWALFHRQVSVRRVAPAPFFLLDDGTSAVPPLFHTMLARVLPLPILPEWTEPLWVEGRLRGLIGPVSACHGVGAWLVSDTLEGWQTLLLAGVASRALAF